MAVYPKKYLDELRSEINEAKAKIAAGEQPVFDTVDALFEALDGADVRGRRSPTPNDS